MSGQFHKNKTFKNKIFKVPTQGTLFFKSCEFENCSFEGKGATSVALFNECSFRSCSLKSMNYKYFESVFIDCVNTDTTTNSVSHPISNPTGETEFITFLQLTKMFKNNVREVDPKYLSNRDFDNAVLEDLTVKLLPNQTLYFNLCKLKNVTFIGTEEAASSEQAIVAVSACSVENCTFKSLDFRDIGSTLTNISVIPEDNYYEIEQRKNAN